MFRAPLCSAQIPVFQISSMAVQAMPVYQSYIEMMNEDVKRAFKVSEGGRKARFPLTNFHLSF